MGRPPCCDKEGVKKGPWTPEEDILLVTYIQEHGPANWRAVPTNTGLLRCSKSCRLRWTNYLRPGIKRGNFTDQEEKTIIHLQALLGNRWAAIASYLPQRTDNDIKNYWNTHLNKKLKKLQTGLEGHPRDGFSASHKMPRGQWEKRLQTDIHMAKQALREALSPEKPSYMSGSKSSDVCSSVNPAQSSTYASSTENISRLLQGWKRNPPKPSQTNSVMTQNSFNNMSSTDSVSSDQGTPSWKSNDKDLILTEAFDSLLCFESFDSSHSDTSQSMSPEATLFQAESKPDSCAQLPFSLLEKWLLFDEGASQGKDFLNDITLDDSANLF